jgi:hypothetical protein
LRNLHGEWHGLIGLGWIRARSRHVIGDSLVFIKTNVASVCANESFIEDTAGKLLELFLFQRTEQTSANLGVQRDVVEGDPPLFPLFFQTIAEGSHATPAP